LRDIDGADLSALFHAGGRVYGVAPDVVGKLPYAHNACQYRPAVYANANARSRLARFHKLQDILGGLYAALCMTGICLLQTANGHKSISYGFDLSNPLCRMISSKAEKHSCSSCIMACRDSVCEVAVKSTNLLNSTLLYKPGLFQMAQHVPYHDDV
jgi:hypothetical protein